jgi:hypothetical protein
LNEIVLSIQDSAQSALTFDIVTSNNDEFEHHIRSASPWDSRLIQGGRMENVYMLVLGWDTVVVEYPSQKQTVGDIDDACWLTGMLSGQRHCGKLLENWVRPIAHINLV